MKSQFLHLASVRVQHWFHVVSNVRPLVWICLYIILIPIFACFYYWMPEGMFRLPDGGVINYGQCLYYSIVTISTLGFGDYTPMHPLSQGVTAVEVMCGLIVLGLFLNAVGSMKSEIDVSAEIEKQRLLREAEDKKKLQSRASSTLRVLHSFVNHCQEVMSASAAKRSEAVGELMKSSARTALALDMLQTHVDLSQWPVLLENSFSFVANYQLLSAETGLKASELSESGDLNPELKEYITSNSKLASELEAELTKFALDPIQQKMLNAGAAYF